MGSRIEATDGTGGFVTELLLDESCWRVRYVAVDTSRFLPGRTALLPTCWVNQKGGQESGLTTDLSVEAVKSGFAYDSDIPITREMEEELFQHYGRKPYWEA
jgi:hypothetical protein